jgi:Ca2+-transporting ATPase
LALVKAELTKGESKKYVEYLHKVQFVGMVAEEDSVRKEAVDAVQKARGAGIETIMITGDHRLAALSIAKQTAIAVNEKQVINGDELALMEDNALLKRLLA